MQDADNTGFKIYFRLHEIQYSTAHSPSGAVVATWALQKLDNQGRIRQYRYGNKITTVKNYDKSGLTSDRLYSQTATLDGGTTGGVIDQRYQYDGIGNLTLRQEAHPAANTSESFAYDSLSKKCAVRAEAG